MIPIMTSTLLPLSRLFDLVRYGHWDQDDVVDLFIALVKQYQSRAITTDFNTWMAKILYQVEIHRINKQDLFSNINQCQSVDCLENRIYDFGKETKEKSLEKILEEIQSEGDIDLNKTQLKQVGDIVLSVASSTSCPGSTDLQDIKDRLVTLCDAVEKTKGWKPRLTQMVSWCIMVLSSSSQLIQVGTGEGKSCIVAMFAAHCALNNKYVDIISSSPVLAERDANDWRPFYEDLKITVDCNANKHTAKDLKSCYACQVVYGTTTDFARDWLRQTFKRESVRPERKFEYVIIDEVDSLMLDKGLEVVYLNNEMPVMEHLNIILAKIWFIVNQYEDLDVEKTSRIIQSITDDSDILPSPKYFKPPTDTKLETNECHIPGFLEHINGRLERWIENAFLAKKMTLGHEYILHGDDVVPVDYSSTGVVQNDMKWGDGLQQFLQMKHQTRLTNMSLITNFMSNVFLFSSYARIYGLTGTLGNKTDLDLLQKLYPDIKTCKIPPFKRRKLYEKDGLVITDENEWVQTICKVVNEEVNPTVYRGSRAVLVICETIQRAEVVYNALSQIVCKEKLKLYTNNNMDNSKVIGEEVKEGCVIVATNLAGRGTDLKVCAEVNNSGGLFVVQTFLPLNIRVEQQAFGRTAREGNPGSAQLIMCSSHFCETIKLVMMLNLPLSMLLTSLQRLILTVAVPEFIENLFQETLSLCKEDPNEKNCEAMAKELRILLNMEKPSGLTNLEIEKQSRDLFVQIRLSTFLEDDIPKITKKETLFLKYLELLEKIPKNGWDYEDTVSSLHECWGMWLLMKFNENESTEILKNQLTTDIERAMTKLACKQSPSSMIYYHIRAGNTLRNKGSLADSIEMYTKAIESNPCWSAIALYNRALSILSKGNRGHIAQALADLNKAEEAVESYMKKLRLTFIFVETSSKIPTMMSDTLLSRQFKAKLLVQELLRSNIQKTIKVLQEAESRGYDVRITKFHTVFLMLNPVVLRVNGLIEVCREIDKLDSLGLDTIFSVEIVSSFYKRLMKLFS